MLQKKRDRQSWASKQGLYNNSAWRKLRDNQRRKNPLCEMCVTMGKMVPMKVVDHITPVTESNWEEVFYDPNNLQSLCVACHSFKTNRDKTDNRDGATGQDLMNELLDM